MRRAADRGRDGRPSVFPGAGHNTRHRHPQASHDQLWLSGIETDRPRYSRGQETGLMAAKMRLALLSEGRLCLGEIVCRLDDRHVR
jgi:hypothetical protein